MAIRFAAASILALAAALVVSPVARAQSFLSFYDISPRQIVGMLEDQGYDLRGPLVRRGDVYVCNVESVSGRSMRLIVSAHDGRVLERFAASRRSHDDEDVRAVRPSRDFDENDGRRSDDRARRNERTAFDDVLNPPSRVYGSDELFSSKPVPPERVPETTKSKRQAAKKHRHSNVAKAPATPTPDATPTVEAAKLAPSSMAAVAPSAETPKSPNVVDSVKPAEPPKVVETPKPVEEARKPVEAPKPVETPRPVETPKAAASPEPVQAKAEVEKPHEVVKPKPDGAHKKINDLPVGTLD